MIKFIINDDSIKPFAKEWFIASILLCLVLIPLKTWMYAPMVAYYYAAGYHIVRNLLKKVPMESSYPYKLFLNKFFLILLINTVLGVILDKVIYYG